MRLASLLYHHVGPRKRGAWPLLSVSARGFEAQIVALSIAGYTGIRASHWIAYSKGEAELPPRPILITFDDAYADIAEHALPVLLRHGFSATIMVVTGQIGGISAWDRRSGFETHPLMNAEQLRAWAARGIELGAHSRSHVDLRGAPPEVLDAEIEGSRRDLEDLLCVPITTFAYPYGYLDEETLRRVSKVYSMAFTTRSGLNAPADSLLRFKRTAVIPQDTIADVLVRARLGWNPLDLVRPGVDAGRRLFAGRE